MATPPVSESDVDLVAALAEAIAAGHRLDPLWLPTEEQLDAVAIALYGRATNRTTRLALSAVWRIQARAFDDHVNGNAAHCPLCHPGRGYVVTEVDYQATLDEIRAALR